MPWALKNLTDGEPPEIRAVAVVLERAGVLSVGEERGVECTQPTSSTPYEPGARGAV